MEARKKDASLDAVLDAARALMGVNLLRDALPGLPVGLPPVVGPLAADGDASRAMLLAAKGVSGTIQPASSASLCNLTAILAAWTLDAIAMVAASKCSSRRATVWAAALSEFSCQCMDAVRD